MEHNVAVVGGKGPGVSRWGLVALLSVVGAAGPAMAVSTLDVTSITDNLAAAGTSIGLVAVAMLAVAGAGIAIKWFLGFLFS